MDESDASCTYLWDARSSGWSPELTRLLGVDQRLLPQDRAAEVLIGTVSPNAAAETGFLAGNPVSAGTSDFAATLLGSGVSSEYRGSDITGTSTLTTAYGEGRDLLARPLVVPKLNGLENELAVAVDQNRPVHLPAGGDRTDPSGRIFNRLENTANALDCPAHQSAGRCAGRPKPGTI